MPKDQGQIGQHTPAQACSRGHARGINRLADLPELRPRFARALESSVEGYPLICTLVPALLWADLFLAASSAGVQSSLRVKAKYPGTIGKNQD
jgi:hypothetical protein